MLHVSYFKHILCQVSVTASLASLNCYLFVLYFTGYIYDFVNVVKMRSYFAVNLQFRCHMQNNKFCGPIYEQVLVLSALEQLIS